MKWVTFQNEYQGRKKSFSPSLLNNVNVFCLGGFSLLYISNCSWKQLVKLTLNIFHDDAHLYEVCVCVCLNQNQISISYGLLKAVSIVMANEQRGFHRFLSQYMRHSRLFSCPSVCSLCAITGCLHGNIQWALARTSAHSLCVPLCACPHALSVIIKHLSATQVQSVGFMSLATAFSFHTLRIVPILIVLRIVPIELSTCTWYTLIFYDFGFMDINC